MSPSLSLWSSAARVAAQTPASRNRYVDFLRALSIIVVISGHWLVAAPYVVGGEITLNSMLAYQEWTQILSWLLQVMPVFFFVGGYSNSVSWQAAMRDRRPYADWLIGRLQRLAAPVLPLLVVWTLLGIGLYLADVRPGIVTVGSRMSLIPIWFLAVYIGVTVLTPLTFAAWQRFGMAPFWIFATLAAINDGLFFAADLRATSWFNYAFVWLAVHQLGYAWRAGRLPGDWKALLWSVSALAILFFLYLHKTVIRFLKPKNDFESGLFRKIIIHLFKRFTTKQRECGKIFLFSYNPLLHSFICKRFCYTLIKTLPVTHKRAVTIHEPASYIECMLWKIQRFFQTY